MKKSILFLPVLLFIAVGSYLFSFSEQETELEPIIYIEPIVIPKKIVKEDKESEILEKLKLATEEALNSSRLSEEEAMEVLVKLKKIDEEKRIALAKKRAEEKRVARAKKRAEEKRVARAKKRAEEKRVARAKKRAEEKRVARAKKRAEEKRVARAKKRAEEKRVALAKKRAEEKRVALAKKRAEEKRVALAKKRAEEKRMALAKKRAEEKRMALTKKRVEEKRIAFAKKIKREQRVALAMRERFNYKKDGSIVKKADKILLGVQPNLYILSKEEQKKFKHLETVSKSKIFVLEDNLEIKNPQKYCEIEKEIEFEKLPFVETLGVVAVSKPFVKNN